MLLAAFWVSPSAHAQSDASTSTRTEEVRQRIRTRIEAERRGLGALNPREDAVHTSDSVMRFYEDRGFEPAWIDQRGPTGAVERLLRVLRRADRDGLTPTDYHVEPIAELLRAHRDAGSGGAARLSDLELLCTDAFLLFGSHLLSGHVSPTEIVPSWNVSQRRADLLQALTEAARTGEIEGAFDAVRPQQPEYRALKDALRRYRTLAADGGWPSVPEGPTLKPGLTGDRVAHLHRRLAVTDASLSPPEADSTAEFDTALEEAVVRFQERHGLEPDGVVGPATPAALNVPAETRVEQLIVNLERWRWLPETLGERHVLVNIAASRLRVVENGETALSMRVVTGRPYRQTPVFSGEISYLVFNPFWHLPHSIATRDKLPEIQKNPGYLARQNIKVFRGWGADAQPIDPSTIDWKQLSASNFPYRLRQDPGPQNALGRVKFMFPNPHSVYLHDTPTRGLFAQAERNFSSGCIRLERPIELAEYLLSDQPQWSPQRIQSVLKTPSAEQSVSLRTRVPVHLQYWTAWAEADGTVHFRNDAYQRDGAVLKALNATPPTE